MNGRSLFRLQINNRQIVSSNRSKPNPLPKEHHQELQEELAMISLSLNQFQASPSLLKEASINQPSEINQIQWPSSLILILRIKLRTPTKILDWSLFSLKDHSILISRTKTTRLRILQHLLLLQEIAPRTIIRFHTRLLKVQQQVFKTNRHIFRQEPTPLRCNKAPFPWRKRASLWKAFSAALRRCQRLKWLTIKRGLKASTALQTESLLLTSLKPCSRRPSTTESTIKRCYQ